MAGVHVIKGAIEVRNVRNVLLVALERNIDLPQIISECRSSGNTSDGNVECYGIRFKHVRGISISSLSIEMIHHRAATISGLTFIDSTAISIQALHMSTNGVSKKQKVISISFSNTTNVEINVFFTANGGIQMVQSRRVDISNVSLENGIMSCLQTTDTSISDVTMTNPNMWNDAIRLQNTVNTAITNVTIHYTREYGAFLLNTVNTEITNVTIHYTRRYGIFLFNTSNTAITNITIHKAHDAGIFMNESNGIDIKGAVVLHCRIGIHSKGVSDIYIIACTVKYTTNYGIYLSKSRQINVKSTKVMYAGESALGVSRVQDCKIIDTVLVNVSAKAALLVISVIDTIIRSMTIVDWTEKAIFVIGQDTINTNLTNLSLIPTKNAANIFDNSKTFNGIVLFNCSNVTIDQSTFKNIMSFGERSDVAFQPSVIAMYSSKENIVIRDCSFEANNITALTVVQSKVRISGNVSFTDNTAHRGAAMTFTRGGKMIVSEDSHITFKNNYARITGGAIYLTTTSSRIEAYRGGHVFVITTECFLQVERGPTKHSLTFLNNRAGLGGNELYGGGLQDACNDKCNLFPQRTSETCLDEFLTVSDIKNSTLSNIHVSSDPSRVCLCVDEKPDCLNIFKTIQTNGHGPYPGQTIEISAVVVGQNFGTVSGAVYAQLIISPFNNNTPKLSPGQDTQGVNHNSCNNLQYTINSPVENITIMLTSTKLKETFTVTEQTFTETKKAYEEYKNNKRKTYFPQAILEYPVYINIPLEPCPPGFSITHKHPVTCDCVRQLRELPGVTCDIEDVTIYRSGQVWVGQLKSTFNETDNDQMNVVSARYCPFNYCKNGGIKIHLSHSHDQCNYNHSGVVCGECIHDLSLVLGSDQCLNCSNTYLLLLLPFAVAGVVLVAFIKLLDITVSSGFINSLIFYTNIVKVNEYIFLPHRTTNPITLFISWFNLDLGIETCFYDGLDAYAKAWLQFVFPFYLWCIAGLIIISARYSTRFARLTGNNSVPVLATLFLLSYAKLLRNVITILSYTTVDTAQCQKVVWSADGNIDYLGPQHIPLFTAAIATLILLWLPYTTLFLLAQWVCTINLSFITRMSMKLKPFLDAHYGPMTDKHRYWFGILLGVRIVILLISAASNFSISAFSVCIAAGALVSYMAIGPPLYRNKHIAVFEVALFINLGLLGLTKFYVVSTDGNQTAATLTLLTVAFVQFLGLVLYRGYSTLKPVFTQYYQRLYNKEEEEEDEIDGKQKEGVWRYDTSMREWEESQNLTPYRDAATAL